MLYYFGTGKIQGAFFFIEVQAHKQHSHAIKLGGGWEFVNRAS
jgi:hypothetical protein